MPAGLSSGIGGTVLLRAAAGEKWHVLTRTSLIWIKTAASGVTRPSCYSPLSALAKPVSVIIGRRPYSDKGVRELSARLVT